MGSKSTIYEVAKLAGVSTATVSRVMHDGRGFSEQTRKAVLRAASDLRWLPNGSARGLAARRAGIVGLLFSDLGKAVDTESDSLLYVDQVIRGAERAATLVGDAVLIAATRSAAGREMARSVAGKVDGLVVLAGSVSGRDLARLSRTVPIVVLAADAVGPRLDVVAADNRGGSREVTAHLVEDHGYRDVAFVAGPARSPDSKERFVGFAEALRQADIAPPDEPDAYGDFTEAGGARAMAALLDRPGHQPRAVVFANDEMAIGALPVLRTRHVRVPAGIAVTGFDDIASTRHVRPALTTVRQPMREIGEQAVRLLLERLADPTVTRRIVMLPTDLVLRSSCGCRPKPPRQPGSRV